MFIVLLAALFWLSVTLVVYAYAGYPILIILLARFFAKPVSYTERFPLVTFLIAAYNEETYIAQKLENTLALDYPPEKLQILVAADGSTDRTPEIVKSFAASHVELNYIPDRHGKMAAIVRAMNAVRGEIIVFSDANNMYESNAIRELVAPFSDPTVGAVTGAKLIIEDGRDLSAAEGLYWKYESLIKKSESDLGSCVSSVGEILAVRTNLFSPPRAKIIDDDQYIVLDILRKGYRTVYVPDARSYEYVSQTAQDEIVRRQRINAGLYQVIAISAQLLPLKQPELVWQMISHKYLRAFTPFAFIFALLFNIIIVILPWQNQSFLLLSPPWGWCVLALQLLFYTMALVGNVFRPGGLAGKVLYIPTFLVNSNLATLMGFYSFLTNKQSHIWQRVRR